MIRKCILLFHLLKNSSSGDSIKWYIIYRGELLQQVFNSSFECRRFISLNSLRDTEIVSESELEAIYTSDNPRDSVERVAHSAIKRPFKYQPATIHGFQPNPKKKRRFEE